MENNNIFWTWKQQMVNRPFNMPMNMTGKTEDDVVQIRKSLDRNGYFTLLAVALSIIMCGHFIQLCYEGGASVGRLFAIAILALGTVAMLRGWWRSYQWKKAEIYSNTKEYLEVSADMIRKYVKNLTYGFYGFYVFLIAGNIILFTAVKTTQDPQIFLIISIAAGISWGMKYTLMKQKTGLYSSVADKLENMVRDLTSQH